MNEASTASYQTPQSMLKADRASTDLLDMHIIENSEGRAVVTMLIRDDMLNGHGIAHGGLIFSLADTAFAFACNEEGSMTVSSGAEITFFAPGRPGRTLTATAELKAKRGRSGIYDVRVTDDGDLIAEFRGHSRTVDADRMRGHGESRA